MHQHSNYRGPRRSREKEMIWEKFWRNYSWKFPQHGKGDSQSSPRVPYRINPRRNTPRHILIKLTKTKHKERILQAARDKRQVTYQGDPIVSSSLKFSIWFFSLSWAACVSGVSGTWRPCVHLSTFAGFWGVHLWGFFWLVFSRHHLLCLGSFASVSATVFV